MQYEWKEYTHAYDLPLASDGANWLFRTRPVCIIFYYPATIRQNVDR